MAKHVAPKAVSWPYSFFLSSPLGSCYKKHRFLYARSAMPVPVESNMLLHLFNGLFSRTAWVSRHQKVNHSGFYWNKRWWGGIVISWTICKSFAPCFRQITTPAPHHSIFMGWMPFLLLNQQCQST